VCIEAMTNFCYNTSFFFESTPRIKLVCIEAKIENKISVY
jgi:hypothetical protein